MADRIAQLNKLLESDPNDAFCLYGLAQEYARLDRHDAAIEHYDRTLAADANYLYAYFHKARSQEALDNQQGAIQTLRIGLERAKAIADAKAAGEIGSYLDQLT